MNLWGNKVEFIGLSRSRTGFILLLAAVLTFLGSSSIVYGASSGWRWDNDHSQDDIGSVARNNILQFENDKVSMGEKLIVEGAPKDSIYQWAITGADGSANTFTTKDNFYTPEASDIEKLITVKVEGDSEAEATIYYSSLPVLYINNEGGYYGVGEEFTDAVMLIQGNQTFDKENELYCDEIQIRLRGNSTKWREKAPFNIKLEEKSDLLGMGKNKHWALLANDIDHTLMRNKLMYDFSGNIGMDTFIKSESVVLIFNNQYYGVYELSELVNLGSDRVDAYDWEESAEKAAKNIVNDLIEDGELSEEMEDTAEENLETAMCTDLSWITSPYKFTYDIDQDGIDENYKITDYIKIPNATGGILLEMDFYAFDGHHPSTLITSYSQPWYFKSPEYAITNDSLYDYSRKYIQSFEYALHSTDFIYHEEDEQYTALIRTGGNKPQKYFESNFTAAEYDGKHYSELFDLDSLVQNFIVCEFAMNWDGMKNSVFIYKDIDSLFHLGPVWDFDWAMGNINMYGIYTWYPISWHTTENKLTVEQYYQTVQWNRSLIRDPYFLARVYEKYKEVRGTVIEDMIKKGGTIDENARYLATAAAANDLKWDYTYEEYQSVGYEQSLTNMKNFINNRINWMDQQFTSLDSLITSLGYYKPSKELSISKVDMKSEKGYALITAEVTALDIASIAFQVNGTHLYEEKVVDGKAECLIPKSALTKDKDTLNVVQILAKDVKGEYIIDQMEEGNYYNAKSNYIVFYSDTDGIDNGNVDGKDANDNKGNSDGDMNNVSDSNGKSNDAVTVTTSVSGDDVADPDSTSILPIAILGLLLVAIGTSLGIRILYKKQKKDKI